MRFIVIFSVCLLGVSENRRRFESVWGASAQHQTTQKEDAKSAGKGPLRGHLAMAAMKLLTHGGTCLPPDGADTDFSRMSRDADVEGKSCIGVFEPSATAALQADKPQAFTVCSDFRSWHKADELDGSL
jgi:hypothetical protein